jgi:sulfite exporter TauE/SafE
MLSALMLLLYGFGWGLRRGASVCVALCVPSIMPRLVDGNKGWRSGLWTAFLYNLPRIVALTALGAAIGAAGFTVVGWMEGLGPGGPLWLAGYMAIGALMAIYGIYSFAKATDAMEDLAEGVCDTRGAHPILSRLGFASPKTDTGLLVWGTIVSLACLSETAIALEGALVGYVSGTSSGSAAAGALLGALTFLAFAIGAALPTLIIGAVGSSALGREKRTKILLQIRRAAAGVMVAIGLIFLFSSAVLLI